MQRVAFVALSGAMSKVKESDEILPSATDNGEAESDEEEEPHHPCANCQFTCLNKFLSFYSFSLSFVAWNMWYYQFTDTGKDPMELPALLWFTGGTLLVLAAAAGWHYSYAKELEEMKEEAMTSKATPADLGASLLEHTYENLTEAIGYILVEVWLKTYHLPKGHPWLSTFIRFAGIMIVVLLFETCERHIGKGGSRAFIDVLGQVVLSGGTFFVVDSAKEVWRSVFDVEEKTKDPGILCVWVAFLTGIAVSFLISYITAKTCHADGKDEDTDTMQTMFGEKVLTLVKGVAFYTAAMLSVDHEKSALTEEDTKDHVLYGLLMFFYSIFAVLGVVLLEEMCVCGCGTHHDKSMETGPRVYWLKFQQDYVSCFLKMQSFVFAMLFIEVMGSGGKGTLFGIGFWFTAIIAQITSLALEYCRVARLKKSMAELGVHDLDEDLEIEAE